MLVVLFMLLCDADCFRLTKALWKGGDLAFPDITEAAHTAQRQLLQLPTVTAHTRTEQPHSSTGSSSQQMARARARKP